MPKKMNASGVAKKVATEISAAAPAICASRRKNPRQRKELAAHEDDADQCARRNECRRPGEPAHVADGKEYAAQPRIEVLAREHVEIARAPCLRLAQLCLLLGIGHRSNDDGAIIE